MLREEQGLGARVLQSLDITDERVATRLGESTLVDKHAVHGPIPFTPRASRALELAIVEAEALGRDTTSTHHLVLGLLRTAESAAYPDKARSVARSLRMLRSEPRAATRPSDGATAAIDDEK